MTTAYTPILKLALPVTGELDGSWGNTVNTAITAMVEEAIAGLSTISTWTGASHTLTTANGATSESRCAMLIFSGAPGAAATVIAPAATKIYVVKNSVSGGYTVTFKVSGQTGITVPNGATMLVYCDGTDIRNALDSTYISGTPVIDSPSLTGTPTAPTPATTANDTKIATTAMVQAAILASSGISASLPAQAGNAGKYLGTNGTSASWSDVLPSQTSNSGKFLTTNGTSASWAFANIAQVTTATGNTTLTSTPTLLQITPTVFGITVTLPDATTCSVGGPLFCIDNRSQEYSVRVVNSAGTLLGFLLSSNTSYVSLNNNSTSAGVWDLSNAAPIGISAKLYSSSIGDVRAVVNLDSDRDFILFWGSDNKPYGVVYRKSTNAFSAVTLIRNLATNSGGMYRAALAATDTVLVVTCPNASTALEAVAVSINPTTDAITVNTAATATLGANYAAEPDATVTSANGSFVIQYTTATPTSEIRAITVSGTTVSIGSATALTGAYYGYKLPCGSGILTASFPLTVGSPVYIRYYSISGTTITGGGTASTVALTNSVDSTGFKFFPLGTRWCVIAGDSSTSNGRGAVISVSGTTPTISDVSLGMTNATDAIKISDSKVLVTSYATSANANILTDSAGTASMGTPITTSTNGNGKFCFAVVGNSAFYGEPGNANVTTELDVSGASPVFLANRRQSYAKGLSSYVHIWSGRKRNNILASSSSVFIPLTAYLPASNTPSPTSIYVNGLQKTQPPTDLDYRVFSTSACAKGSADTYLWAVCGINTAINAAYGELIKVECIE